MSKNAARFNRGDKVGIDPARSIEEIVGILESKALTFISERGFGKDRFWIINYDNRRVGDIERDPFTGGAILKVYDEEVMRKMKCFSLFQEVTLET